MKSKITILILSLFSLSVFSQNSKTLVQGKVSDISKQPIVYAVITVLNHQNNSIVKQAVTDEQGKFKLKVEQGDYSFLVSGVGFESLEKRMQVTKSLTVNFTLKEELNDLGEVVLVAKKRKIPIKVEGSKISMNIQGNQLLKGVGTAIDVLKRTPGVFVDGQNHISIAGLKGTQIFINGKKTYVSAEGLTSYLKSIASRDIAKIEVMSSPPVSYDADGSGGVINIQLTQKSEKGIHFSINNTLSYWENIRHQMNTSLSYATDEWVLNSSYFHTLGHYNMAYGMERWQDNSYISTKTADTDKRNTINGKINALWTPDERNSVGVNVSVNTLFGPGITNTESFIYDKPTMDLVKKLVGENDYFKQRANRYGLGAFYQLNTSENSFYKVDLDVINYDGFSKNNQPNTYYDPQGNILKDDFYVGNNNRDIMIYSLALTNHRAFLGGILDAGAKLSNVDSDNGFEFSKKENNTLIKDLNRSNDYSYQETNAHGFLQYSIDLSKKYSLKMGLRGEYTQINGSLKSGGKLFENKKTTKNHFFNVFPNVVLTYHSTPYQLEFNYSKRIDRPRYEDLNPFEYLLDELTYWKGNPFLEPQISDKISLSYGVKNTSLTLSYNHIDNYMAYMTDTFGLNSVVMTTKNMGVKQQWAMNYIQSAQLLKGWDINLSAGVYYTLLDLEYTNKIEEKYRRFSAGISIQSSVQLPYKIAMDISGRYNSKRPGNTYEVYPASGALDIGVSRNFLKDQLKVSILATDIFHSEIWDNYGSKPDLRIESWGYGESRQIKLSVLYNWGAEPKQKVSKDKIEEINRL